MWLDKLQYRDNLGVDAGVTFGIEIEFDKARKSIITSNLNDAYNNNIISKSWMVENEETIYDGALLSTPRGGEVISDILTDNKDTWHDVKYVCDNIRDYGGVATTRCGAHVHVGPNVFKEKMVYYERLMKLWIVYEGVILRFCF